jgi:hypothetical protein
VHGWSNNNIWVDNVHIKDFETAGIQINGATNTYITNSEIGPSLGHASSVGRVPGMATLSHALMLLRIVDGESIEDQDVAFANLRASTERYIAAMLTGGPIGDTERVFENPSGVPDGSAIYGMILHPPHIAIHDFAACPQFLEDAGHGAFGPVTVKDVLIRDLTLQTDEVIHMKGGPDGKPVMGPAGDVVQIFRAGGGGTYAGTILTDAQVALGRLKLAYPSSDEDEIFNLFGATNIPAEFVAWSTGEKDWDSMVSEVNGHMVCMKDAMTHHNKGAMGMRIEYYNDLTLSGVHVRGLTNTGQASEVSHCTGDELVYTGNDARGITFSHVHGIKVEDVTITGLNSERGWAYGVEERVEVEHDGEPDWTFEGIHGGEGSIDCDTGLDGMLDTEWLDR